jgi:hypothetical protein
MLTVPAPAEPAPVPATYSKAELRAWARAKGVGHPSDRRRLPAKVLRTKLP